MSVSPHETGYLNPPKRLGTKDEVLAMLHDHVMNGMKCLIETREQRMQRKFKERHEAKVWHANTFAGPGWVAVGPVKPSFHNDERFKNYVGRYGQIRND